jgi:NAD(P)-dependent dehydrogenase (short-subunit alcohol dehydrogenase family)
MTWNERVGIVAGASGGIGTATVHAMLRDGMTVVLAAPQDALLDAIAADTQSFGPRVLVVPTDITDRHSIDVLVAQTLVKYGRLDALVNVAGIGSAPAFADSSDEEIERVLAINLLGAARLMHAVLPIMKAQRRGAIVNIGSIAGEAGIMGIYSSSKFGLRGLTDSVRREVRSDKIGVTLIEPGFVRTAMNAAMNGLPGPEIVADAIVAAIHRPRRLVIVPSSYRLPLALIKAFPDLVDVVFGDARIQSRLNRDARAARADAQAQAAS